MRLIDADALRKAFEAWKTMDDYYHNTDCDDIPLSEAYDLIDNAPTIARTERPLVIIDNKVLYITQGHIDAMIKYEQDIALQETVSKMLNSLEEMKNLSLNDLRGNDNGNQRRKTS